MYALRLLKAKRFPYRGVKSYLWTVLQDFFKEDLGETVRQCGVVEY